MVYSTVCRWLEDYLADEELEIHDTWDFIEWIEESEIAEVFKECLLNTLGKAESRRDAEAIFYSLLWEHYLLRRDIYNSQLMPDESVLGRLSSAISVKQQTPEWFSEKRNLVTASEFYLLLDKTKARQTLIREKVRHRISDSNGHGEQIVALTPDKRRLSPMAWGHRYEPVIRNIYAKYVAKGEVCELGRLYHPKLAGLAASPDGLVMCGPRTGRLLEIKAPVSREIEDDIVPEPYYIQIQVQMEVCDVAAVDYCECRISAGPTWSGTGVGPYVGVVTVVGAIEDASTWQYEYSPLYENTAAGRALADVWEPIGDVLERHVWEIEKIQTITVKRNPRWWKAVGLPAYNQFWRHVAEARADPMFLSPAFLDEVVGEGQGAVPVPAEPMFVD